MYKVALPVINKIAALKRLEPNPMLLKLMGKKPLIELFISEAVKMASIRHPHVTEIHDYHDAGDNPFYLMDYCCNNLGDFIGETYRTEAPSRILPIDRAVGYTLQTLSGLKRLHFEGIIHRDMKPFNLLIDDRDMIKICDFGLSKIRGEHFAGPSNLNVGSPFYAAPEQVKNPDKADAASDLFAVGVMFYRMLTGELPPEQDSDKWGKRALSVGDRNPELKETPDLNHEWDDFTKRATHPEKTCRFASADEMQNVLTDLFTEWKTLKERTCLFDDVQEKVIKPQARFHINLRSEPIKAGVSKGRETFGVDELWRPEKNTANRFTEFQTGFILDEATHLVWEKSGSMYPMDYSKAKQYINHLNKEKKGGRNNWRLPTVDELLSLISIPSMGDFCLEPVFDKRQKWLWSIDQCAFTSAWFVSMDLGFLSKQDKTASYYVKATATADHKMA